MPGSSVGVVVAGAAAAVAAAAEAATVALRKLAGLECRPTQQVGGSYMF